MGAGFKSAVAQYFPGKDPGAISTIEWKRLIVDDFKPLANPIGATQEFQESDIPF